MTRLFRKANSAIQALTGAVQPTVQVRGQNETGSPTSDPANEYSAASFNRLLSEIRENLDVSASGRPSSEESSQQLVEAIRQATEVLVWGERHDETLFDLFCESQVLASFVRTLLAQSTPEVVQVQLLQTLSILVQNAHRSTSFFYLLSGGHLNTLLSGALDFEDDEVGHIYGALNMHSEEVLAYFLALVKGLALRLDGGSAQLCIDTRQAQSEAHGFPLFAQAVRFTTHKDAMVRTGARAALLSILRIDHVKVRGHTVEAAMAMLVPSLAQALRVAWAASSAAVQLQDAGTLQMALEAEEDLLAFLNDLLLLDIPALGEALAQGVLAGAFLPLLLGLLPCAASREPPAEDFQGQRRPAVQDIERAIASQTAGLEPAQRGLVGAVVERVLGHSSGTTASVDPAEEGEAQQVELPVSPASPSHTSMRLIASIETEEAQPPSPEHRPRAPTSAEEDSGKGAQLRAMMPPSVAVVVRAVAACARALGTHRHVVEPLAKVLLWPTLPAGIAAAVHSPGVDGAHLAALLLDKDAWKAKQSVSGPSTVTGELDASVTNPNPFRSALLQLIGDGKTPAPAEAPIVAWTFLELQASLSPQMLEGTGLLLLSGRRSRGSNMSSTDAIAAEDGSPSSEAPEMDQEEAALPEHLIAAICVHARLPRIAQKAVASALVDLVSPPRASATRRRITWSVGQALREAAELFREAMRYSTEEKHKEYAAASAISAFLEEWEWYKHRHSPVDLPAVCGGVQCLLRSGNRTNASLTSIERSSLATHGARSLLTLRRLCVELAALNEGAVQEDKLELCPLKVDTSISEAASVAAFGGPQYDALEGPLAEAPNIAEFVAAGEGRPSSNSAASVNLKAAEVIECTEPCGEERMRPMTVPNARVLVLHPTLLLVTEPAIGDGGVAVVRARMPVWQVSSAIDPADPHLLRVTELTATRWDRSDEPKALVLHFKDIGDSTRALHHLRGSREREAQRLLTQLDFFVDSVLSEEACIAAQSER